jgi:hypothetical protein
VAVDDLPHAVFAAVDVSDAQRDRHNWATVDGPVVAFIAPV